MDFGANSLISQNFTAKHKEILWNLLPASTTLSRVPLITRYAFLYILAESRINMEQQKENNKFLIFRKRKAFQQICCLFVSFIFWSRFMHQREKELSFMENLWAKLFSYGKLCCGKSVKKKKNSE